MQTKSSKKWLVVTVSCPEKIVEAVADQMGVLSGVGVEIHPVDSAEKQTITGFFALAGDRPAEEIESEASKTLLDVTQELEKVFAIYNLILHEPVTRIIDDQDWETSWQKFFTTIEIVPGLVIKPSWEQYTPEANQHVIKMDPGMAFGTGQHPSTKLALTLMSTCYDTSHNNKPGRVLDVGTGTGILAMAAAAYGADQIMAIDNDSEAVKVAQQNVHANHFDWNVGVSTRPIEDLEGPYDLVCANIVHDTLVDMVQSIGRLAANNCYIILSGILNGEQEKNIEHVYQENGMHLIRSENEQEWTAMLLQRSA